MLRLGVKTEKALTVEQWADISFKKNAKAALKRSSDELLKHVKFQLLRRRGPEPSGPGEPPVRQTGKLAKSFKRLRVRLRKGYGSSGVTSDLPRAYVLEYGETKGSRKAGSVFGKKSRARTAANKFQRGLGSTFGLNVYRVAPRPYLDPASEDAEPEITRILTEVVR